MYTFFLGSNPRLSSEEVTAVLRRVSPSYTVLSATNHYIRVVADLVYPEQLLKAMGGTIRICQDRATWQHKPTADEILDSFEPLPPKWTVGIGMNMGIHMKKAARARGSKLSFIEPRSGTNTLNAAQVIFNNLTKDPNKEIILLQEAGTWILMETLAVQDITTYELRDTRRPARDAKVGMLPPKLAQMMINIALQNTSKNDAIIYDPFCGMGTILQEAWLMGIDSVGSDASQRMVEYSEKNLNHIATFFPVERALRPRVFLHDVTNPSIEQEIKKEGKRSIVVTEPYLGRPLTRPLSPTEVKKFFDSVVPLYRILFVNMKTILEPSGELLILFPAPRVSKGGQESFTPLPRAFLDEVSSLGYRISTGSKEPLLYARPDAFIARELTFFTYGT